MQRDAAYVYQAQDVPFAAGFEQQPTLEGVCILRQTHHGQSVGIDASVLHGVGLKTRPSTTCAPDVIITTPALPAPLAVMVAEAATQDMERSIDNPDFMQRCARMANTFRLCWLFVPYILASHPAVLEVVCDCRYKGKVTLHYYTPNDGLSSSILEITKSLVLANSVNQQESIGQQHVASATSAEALQECLASISSMDPIMPNQEQLKALVGLAYGSLHQLAVSSTGEDVMACVGCADGPAQRLWWLFNGIES